MGVKRWRMRRQLTQQALADKVGIHRVYLARLEAGTRTPSLRTLKRLAKALKVTMADLLD